MESGIKSTLRIGGMSCTSCQNRIEKKLRKLAGVRSAKVSYRAGTADIRYDASLIGPGEITTAIHTLGYQVLTDNEAQRPNSRVPEALFVIVSLYAFLQYFGILNLLVPGQLADTGMGYGLLFVIGLMTSVHCIAMCGGINLSQCVPRAEGADGGKSRFSTFRPAFLYNLGRVISYTLIGFLMGLVGGLLGGSGAGLPMFFQGVLKLIVGVFMVIMGINMLGLFPWLRKLQPGMPKIFARKITSIPKSQTPLMVGLLNGLMPCGPLQSMQIVALASGNPLAGALSMFLFSLGTVPLMLGLGAIVSALGKKFAQKVTYSGAILLVVLGLAMLSQGGSLSGLLPPNILFPVILALAAGAVVSSLPFRQPFHRPLAVLAAFAVTVLLATGSLWNSDGKAKASDAAIQIVNGKQIIRSTLAAGRYPNITVRAGTPVKWIIDAPKGSLNGCNYKMVIWDYGIEHVFQPGENVIEFTPAKAGNVRYTCWMGMIRGNITVTNE